MTPLIKILADDPRLNGPQLMTYVPALGEEVAITFRGDVVTLQVNDHIYDVEELRDRRGQLRQQAVVTLVCTAVRRLTRTQRLSLQAS